MLQKGDTSVPKFGSFKPRPNSKANPESVGEDPKLSGIVHDVGDKRSSYASEGLVSKTANRLPIRSDSEINKSNDRRLEQRANFAGEKKIKLEATIDSAEFSDLFIVDRRGDRKNVEFGSLHRSDIPAYRSAGYGRILGLVPSLFIDRDASSDKEVTLRYVTNSEHDRMRRPLLLRHRKDDHKPLLIIPEINTSSFEGNKDFLDLTSGQNDVSAPGEQENRNIDIDYRSLDPMNAEQSYDLRNSSGINDFGGVGYAEREVQTELAEASRKVKQDPSNVRLWLALIELQVKLVHLGVDESMFSSTETHALAELRLSICEQALSRVRRDAPGREQLLVIMQHERSKLWEKARLLKAWDSILEQCSYSPNLWIKYLDEKQSSALSFSFESCKREYVRCLQQLQLAKSSNTLRSSELGKGQIHALLRLTAFMRDAGYEEYANGMWQAVLEYYLFRPPVDNEADNNHSFKDFWESDIPRIGEENARGWSNFVINGAGENKRSPSIFADEQTTLTDLHASIESFGREERRTSNMFHLPACTDQEEQSEDPFREVMFSDLEEALLCLSDALPSENVVDAFLSFMHLPQRPSATTEFQDWRNDPCIRTQMPTLEGSLNHPNNVLITNSLVTTLSLFTGAFKNCHLQIPTHESEINLRLRFVDRVLESLSLTEQIDESLGEYWIAFKLYAFPGEVLKCSKRLLKKWPSSLRLYNAFALAQVGIDRFEKALEVWSAGIRLSSALPQDKQDDVIYIWHSLISSYIQNNKLEDARQCILSIADGILPGQGSTKPSSSMKLKTVQHLQEQFETMLFRNRHVHAVLYAECDTLLTYLSEGLALEPAMKAYDTFATRLQDQGTAFMLELLHQAKASLINVHLEWRRAYKPVYLRACLSRSIELFPENSAFLELYCRIGNQTRLDDRLRSTLHDPLSHDVSKLGLIGCSGAIAQELYRYHASGSGSSAESVRSLFARILLSPTSRAAHSPFLWSVWLSFESHHKTNIHGGNDEYHRQETCKHARRVFLDGVRWLPWCKTWIINGWEILGQSGVLQKQELKQLYEVMVEREMRIRVNLETSDG